MGRIGTTTRQLFSIAELREVTGLGRSKLLEELYSGRLGSVRVGRRRLVSRAQLDAWISALEAQSTGMAR